MKHNNMRDIEAEIEFNARAERLKKDAKHEHDKKLSRNPVTMDSVPDSDDYKVRYEQAMNILGTIFTLYDPPISFSDTEWINRINTQCQRYKELRDSE